ncbi:unnamed protein product [Triticum turgidum subsp. durum]|uniref:AB hydrolase-1 domain-containing protein n=1 Tax=Triticum turgidum subsp. durum TaxID=4567 RepID=A0A9R1Q8T3_TRITD|nr:unnamed protein product [Triticum turgidum subsp. durum]
MGFGVVSLLNAVFRRAFTSAGLRPSSVAVDADTTLHFWAHPSLLSSPDAESKQRGRRPVVVLIHGFGPDPTWQWASQVGPLSKHFDLIVPTLLFFGASTTRAPGRSDAFQAAAIAKLLASDHLAAGDGRVVHVVGTSYGGLVAYHLARALQQGGGAWTVGKVAVCSSDLAKGPEDDRALAAKGGVADVTELMVPADTKALRRLMDICAHGPPKYLPECLARDLLRVPLRPCIRGLGATSIEKVGVVCIIRRHDQKAKKMMDRPSSLAHQRFGGESRLPPTDQLVENVGV